MFKAIALLLTAYFPGMLWERQEMVSGGGRLPICHPQVLAELFFFFFE